MTTKFNIGDTVFVARVQTESKYVPCPDCGGTKTLKAVMWDGTEHVIDCRGCQSGYELPTGRVLELVPHNPSVIEGVVTGVQLCGSYDGKTEYSGYGFRCTEDDIFVTKEEALQRSVAVSEQYAKEQNARAAHKYNDKKSWAWNAHYHRDCIRRAERDLIHHREKLDAAKKHVKEEKAQ